MPIRLGKLINPKDSQKEWIEGAVWFSDRAAPDYHVYADRSWVKISKYNMSLYKLIENRHICNESLFDIFITWTGESLSFTAIKRIPEASYLANPNYGVF